MKKEIKSVFVKEQKHYTKQTLCDLFSCDQEKCRKLIKKLKEHGIVKPFLPKKTRNEIVELTEDDYEVEDDVTDDEIGYVFKYVGVVSLYDTVIKVFPKYISDERDDNLSPLLKQIIKVLAKYNSKHKEMKLYTESDDAKCINMLPLMIFFLNDYFENGLYTNDMTVLEINGEGEIIWDRTISDTFALISNNRPYYPEMITRRRISDNSDLFRRLHAVIISECSAELDTSGLTDLFELEIADISDETLYDLGDAEYLMNEIEKELNIQFNSRKQIILKAMYTYLAEEILNKNNDSISFWGTSSFHVVWEKVCSEVFENQLSSKLKDITVPNGIINEKYDSNSSLLEIIDKPDWVELDESGDIKNYIKASDTLTPDCITINGSQFAIIDAKYYRIKIENGKINGQPGIEDITKQHLYELVYRDFVEKHGFKTDNVKNCFLVPTEHNEICDISIADFKPLSVPLKLHPIKVKGIPARDLYDKYLNGQKYSLMDLKLQ